MNHRPARYLSLLLGAALLLPSSPGQARAVSQETTSPAAPGSLEQRLVAAGLVAARSLDPSLLVELKYASPSNVTGAELYGGLQECYVQPEVARMLKRAHQQLKQRHPGLRLLLVDGVRPVSVQRKLWDRVKGTAQQPYVANPASGSMHNYGAAVDVTLADPAGKRLDMGTPMDHFGRLAQPRLEEQLLAEGLLTRQQVWARRLLREVMVEAGFQPLAIEWWHFNAADRATVRRRYRRID